MIRVTVYKDKEDQSLKGFRVEGHSGYGAKGSDIVCAAVSITAENALNALEELCGWKDFYKIDEKGLIDCSRPADAETGHGKAATAEVILRLTEIGFNGIADQYGKYVQVATKEV